MKLGIDRFMSFFKHGIANPSRYNVSFTLPRGIPAFEGSAVESQAGNIRGWDSRLNGHQKINLLCHTCTMPQRSLMTYQHKQLNAPYNVPYSQSYDPVSFVFYGDANLEARRYFEIWQNAVVNIQSNTFNFYSEYVSDVYITQLDSEGLPTYGVKLIEAWPINITAVDYSYSNNNTFVNITTVLTYKSWTSLTDFRNEGRTV